MASLAEDIIKMWKADANVRAEFTSLGTYAAFREAEAAGRAKIYGGATVQKGAN